MRIRNAHGACTYAWPSSRQEFLSTLVRAAVMKYCRSSASSSRTFPEVMHHGTWHMAHTHAHAHAHAQCTMHNAQCTMHSAQCTMHNAQCTVHNAQCTMHNAQCKWHNAQCTLHNAHAPYTMHHAPCTMHIAPCTCTMHHAPCTMYHAHTYAHTYAHAHAPCTCTMHHAPCTMRHAQCAMLMAWMHMHIMLYMRCIRAYVQVSLAVEHLLAVDMLPRLRVANGGGMPIAHP